MEPVEAPDQVNESAESRTVDTETREDWIYRGLALLFIALLLWVGYRNRYTGGTILLIAPLVAGALVPAMRLRPVSDRVNSWEAWLQMQAKQAGASEGKFARFFRRPLFATCHALWRWTVAIPDEHVRAGLRITLLIFICGIAINLLLAAVYIVIAIAVLAVMIMVGLWILSNMGSGEPKVITRHGTDFFGNPKDEHFDGSGKKIGESRPDTDFFGNPKVVHRDAEGNAAGESRPDTDFFGNPKTVHRDAEGNFAGESRPDTDFFGNPITVHKDAEGNVVGESREETTLFGTEQTVRYEK